MKPALLEIADHNTAGSNDAPATARAGRRRTRSATRRAAEGEPSAPAPAAPPRRRRRRAPLPAPAEPELPGSDDAAPAPAPAPAPAQPPAPAPQQVVDLTRDDDAADTPAAAPPPPPAPAPAAASATTSGPAAGAPPQRLRLRRDDRPSPPPSDRRHLASKRAPAPGRGATIVGVRSTRPGMPLAKRSPARAEATEEKERAGSASLRRKRRRRRPPLRRPRRRRRRAQRHHHHDSRRRGRRRAAPPPRQLAPPDPRQTCDACGAPACLETDRGGGDAASYALNLRRPRRWRASPRRRRGVLTAMACRSRTPSTRHVGPAQAPRASTTVAPARRFAGAGAVVARDRIDAAAPRVEGAWQRAFARAAEAVGVEAARRLAERQQAPDDYDPFGALLGEAEASRRKPTRPTQMYARAGEEIVTRDEDRADGWPSPPAARAARTANL